MAELILFYGWVTPHCGPPRWLSGKESASKAGAAEDVGLIPGSGRSSRGGNGNPFKSSCQDNPMDYGLEKTEQHDSATKHTHIVEA